MQAAWFMSEPEFIAILVVLALMLSLSAYRAINGNWRKTVWWTDLPLGIIAWALWVELLWRRGVL
jgi:hypothetical protein